MNNTSRTSILLLATASSMVLVAVPFPAQAISSSLDDRSAAGPAASTVTIDQYVAGLVQGAGGNFRLTWRNEPGVNGVTYAFRSASNLLFDQRGSALETVSDPDYPNSPGQQVAVFNDYSYQRFGLLSSSPPWIVGLTYDYNTPLMTLAGFVLARGTGDYEKYRVGTVKGNTVTWSNTAGFDGSGDTFETTCQQTPSPTEPLCRITFKGRLNAVVHFERSDEQVTRPTIARITPPDFSPVTNQYESSTSLQTAAKNSLPTLGSVRKALGKSVRISSPSAVDTAATFGVSYTFTSGPKSLANVRFISVRDFDLYVQSITAGPPGQFDNAKQGLIFRQPALLNQRGLAVAKNGMLVLVTSMNLKTAERVLSLLR